MNGASISNIRVTEALVSTVVEKLLKTRLFRPYKSYTILTRWRASVRQDARTCRGKLGLQTTRISRDVPYIGDQSQRVIEMTITFLD